MTDSNDTIEIDRETLKEFAYQNYNTVAGFYPFEEFAELTAEIDDPYIGGYDEQYGYAQGNLIGQLDALQMFEEYFDIDMEELARQYAEEHDKEPFGGLPIDDSE